MHALRRRSTAGFTLVELVMVLVLVGVLAVVALPKMVSTSDWALRAFSDDLVGQTLAARRLALSQRRPVVATITPTGVSFAYAAGGSLGSLPCPAAVSPCIAESGTRTVTFNVGNTGATATSSAGPLTVTVSGNGYSRVLQIAHETGHIQAPS